MKKILTILILMISISVFSQEKTYSGIVKDATGYPAIGVAIVVKGTNNVTATDIDGKYLIKAMKGAALIFSYIGMETAEIKLGDQQTVNITLKNKDTQLDEVVVVGYGTVKKSDLTGSVSSLKGEELTKIGTVGIDQALAGRVAGLVVTQGSGEPGTGSSIKIRGISSLNGSEPLYIIDGVPIDNTSVGGLGNQDMASSALSPMSLVNPSDIESIEVLKDASATSIYGSRGANGVIMITTKKGKVGKGIIAIDIESGTTTVPHFIDELDSNQYTIIREEAWKNAGNLTARNQVRLDSANAGLLKTTDWQKSIIHTGSQTNTNLNFSGGSKEIRYLISNSILDIKGIIDGTNYQRITSRVNLDAGISEKLRVGTTLNYAHVNNDQSSISTGVNNLRGATSAITRALLAAPTTGLLADDNDDGIELWTPTTALAANKYNNIMTQLIANMYLQYDFTKDLNFKSTFAYQQRNTAQRYYQYNILPNNVAEGGRAKTGDTRASTTTFTNTLNYNKKIKEHAINALLGQSMESNVTEGVYVSNYGFANDLLTYYDPGSAAFKDPDKMTYFDTHLASFFGRINYSYKNKFLLTFSGRFDGASKFAENNKWAFFPSGAISYKLSEEKFIKNINSISELKLRLSYGTSGNQAISTYQSLDQYASGLTPFNESTTTIYYQSQLPNPDLTWETTTQLDAGIDVGFFKRKLTATFDYYNKLTDDLLFTGNRIPVQSGQTTFTQNYGSLETKGYEAAINAHVITKKDFSWTMKGNFSAGKTKVKDMASNYLFSGWNPGFIPGGTQRLIVGEEIGTFFGYNRTGIAQFNDFVEFQGLTNEQSIAKYNAAPNATYNFVSGYSGGQPEATTRKRPGEQLYEDIDGDGKISAIDRKIIGQAQPDFTFGIDNAFTFGNVDFSFFIDSQQGGNLANVQNIDLLNFKVDQQGLALASDRWTPENPSTVWPRVDYNNGVNKLFTDRYIEDASFVRLQNITIGYNLDNDLIKKLNISSLRLYVSGSNIYMWTKYTGFTPDVSLLGSSTTNLGHDNAGYPATRYIRMGLNIKL
jgi:TonB-linked SusC/RagA family outer membrane protein